MIKKNMKKFAVIAIIAILGVFALGAVDLALISHAEHPVNCIVSPLIQEDCLFLAKGFQFAVLHLQILKSFALAVFNSSGFLILLSLIFFALVFYLKPASRLKPAQAFSNFSQKINQLKSYSSARQKFISWLSLFEHSPTSL